MIKKRGGVEIAWNITGRLENTEKELEPILWIIQGAQFVPTD